MKNSNKLLAAFLLTASAMILGGCAPLYPHDYCNEPTEIVIFVPVPAPMPYPHPGPDYEPAPAPPRYEPLTKPDNTRAQDTRTKTRDSHFASHRPGTDSRRDEAPRKSPRLGGRSGRNKSGNR